MSNMSVGVSVGFGACGVVDRGDSLAMDGRFYRSALCATATNAAAAVIVILAVTAVTQALRYLDDNTWRKMG